MIQTATEGQIKRMHGILGALKKQGVFSDMVEYKASLALQFSGGRTSSTKELNNYEAAELIGALQRMVKVVPPDGRRASPCADVSRGFAPSSGGGKRDDVQSGDCPPQGRSQETKPNGDKRDDVQPLVGAGGQGGRNPEADVKRKRLFAMCHQMAWYLPGTRVVDKARLDGWCCKYGQFKKPLMAHRSAELSKIIVQMEKAFADYLRGSR